MAEYGVKVSSKSRLPGLLAVVEVDGETAGRSVLSVAGNVLGTFHADEAQYLLLK